MTFFTVQYFNVGEGHLRHDAEPELVRCIRIVTKALRTGTV